MWFASAMLWMACARPPEQPAIAPVRAPAPSQSNGTSSASTLWWSESFDAPLLHWRSPSGHSVEQIGSVYSIQHEGPLSFLRARHDAREGAGPRIPAVHYGTAIEPQPALERVKLLRWRWRVRQHPQTQGDAWEDVAASVYVVVVHPGLFRGGKGFKFAWLSRPGPAVQTWQRGLAQIELRSEPAGMQWRTEEVDVCALYRKVYGPCEGEQLEYVGVVTDADGTRSVAEADYAAFELQVAR